MKFYKNILYSDIGNPNQVLDVYLPENEEFDVFVYFHGGGLESGRKEVPFLNGLVEKGIAVVSANYRMYPSSVFPEFVRDAAAAVAWTFKHINEYGKCKKIFVGGSSAGGYLSMMLCFNKAYLAPYHIKPTQIAGFIHDAGQPTSHYNVLRERGIDSRRVIVDETAPLYYIGLEPEYAPMLFIVSDNDIENRYEQTMLVLSTMKHFQYDMSKVEFKLMHGSHCQYLITQDQEGNYPFTALVYDYITSKENKS